MQFGPDGGWSARANCENEHTARTLARTRIAARMGRVETKNLAVSREKKRKNVVLIGQSDELGTGR